jgi:hypothetical protein
MPPHIQNGLVTIGIGLLIGFFGLLWVANLFGVADEHAKLTSENRVNRWLAGEKRSPAEIRNTTRFKWGMRLGRFLAGGGFMLVGLVIVVEGVRYLVSAPIR